MSLTVGDAQDWQTVAAFLRGELDHEDELTRIDIAGACGRLDYRAHARLMAGKHDFPATWAEHLQYVRTGVATR